MWSPLRASSDHCFIVGALRAQSHTNCTPSPFSSCAFCEQEGWPGGCFPILPAAEPLAVPLALAGASKNVDADVSCCTAGCGWGWVLRDRVSQFGEEGTRFGTVLWNFRSVLHGDGMNYGDYVEQLTYLLQHAFRRVL